MTTNKKLNESNKDNSAIKAIVRQARRLDKLGKDTQCLICCVNDVPLIKARVARSVLEAHHVVLIGNDPSFVVTACLNCHHRHHNRMRDAGIIAPDGTPRTILEVAIDWATALALFLTQMVTSMGNMVQRWRDLERAFDTHCPQWRQWPEVQW